MGRIYHTLDKDIPAQPRKRVEPLCISPGRVQLLQEVGQRVQDPQEGARHSSQVWGNQVNRYLTVWKLILSNFYFHSVSELTRVSQAFRAILAEFWDLVKIFTPKKFEGAMLSCIGVVTSSLFHIVIVTSLVLQESPSCLKGHITFVTLNCFHPMLIFEVFF